MIPHACMELDGSNIVAYAGKTVCRQTVAYAGKRLISIITVSVHAPWPAWVPPTAVEILVIYMFSCYPPEPWQFSFKAEKAGRTYADQLHKNLEKVKMNQDFLYHHAVYTGIPATSCRIVNVQRVQSTEDLNLESDRLPNGVTRLPGRLPRPGCWSGSELKYGLRIVLFKSAFQVTNLNLPTERQVTAGVPSKASPLPARSTDPT